LGIVAGSARGKIPKIYFSVVFERFIIAGQRARKWPTIRIAIAKAGGAC
jgi:hypothetical protein